MDTLHIIKTSTARLSGQSFQYCENCETTESLLQSTNCYAYQPGDDDD